jgi:hypothetical protein
MFPGCLDPLARLNKDGIRLRLSDVPIPRHITSSNEVTDFTLEFDCLEMNTVRNGSIFRNLTV